MKIRFLSAVVAAAISIGAAQATELAKAPTTQQQAAKAEIDRLVQRIQELSGQLGEDTDVRVIVRRGEHMGPMGPGEHEQMIERMGPDGGPRKIRIERMGPDSPMQRDIRIERLAGDKDGFRPGPGLGIVLAPNPAASGVRIAAVSPDSPAMKAGLRSGDVMLAVNGTSVGGNGVQAVDRARELLSGLKQGQAVKLRYAREGKTFDAVVKADAIRRVMVINREEGGPMDGMPGMHEGGDEHRRQMRMMSPDVELEIERMGPMHDCAAGDEDCGMPALFQAFRWQGLNLASIDAGLGKYFGTSQGVLVLSSSADLKGLQSGDVIQRVAGAEVKSPREVMRALREKESGSQLRMDVLREHKAQAVTITVPKSRPLPFMAPPPPAPPAPPARPAPPAPPPAPPSRG